MDQITIEGVRPYDGSYDLDLVGQPLTVREWGWVKRFTGYLPLSFDDGLAGVDAEVMAVLALIALVRSGRVSRDEVALVWERFLDAPGVLTVSIQIDADEVEADDADPPPESSNENGGSSGIDSPPSSAIPAALMGRTGTPASATSESRPVT